MKSGLQPVDSSPAIGIGICKSTTSEDIEARYAAYGWHVARCDGLSVSVEPLALVWVWVL